MTRDRVLFLLTAMVVIVVVSTAISAVIRGPDSVPDLARQLMADVIKVTLGIIASQLAISRNDEDKE